MPKKWLRRISPNAQTVKNTPSLRILGPLIEDPNLFHLNRYSVSMAFLVGIFIAFLPIPGQMLLAAALAFQVRCNLPIAMALIWITNPLTIAPMFFMTYKLGSWLLETPPVAFSIELSWAWINSELKRIWKPLIVGSLCAGSFFSLLSYFTVKYLWRLIVVYQWHHRRDRRRKHRP